MRSLQCVESTTAAAELLKALANPLRLQIVMALQDGPRCVHELVDELEVSQPLVSQHLRVLRSAHLLRTERRGREIAYVPGIWRLIMLVIRLIPERFFKRTDI